MTTVPIDTELARRRLEAQRERLLAAYAQVSADYQEELASGAEELSSIDQHPAEAATETEDLERDLSLAESLEAELAEVDDAFSRLAEGTYGRCEVDGEPIPGERLEALPAARRCTSHQAALEQGGTR